MKLPSWAQDQHLFVTGIGTGVGKTVVAGALCAALNRPYWKPVQTGAAVDRDRDWIHGLGLAPAIFDSVYDFRAPVSPHLAAKLEVSEISLAKIVAAAPQKAAVIEGAGGILVPLNQQQTMLDLVRALQAAVIVVSKNYLGSINHTLMTLEILRIAGLPVVGVIFSGTEDVESETIIEQLGRVPVLAKIPQQPLLDRATLRASLLKGDGAHDIV